MGFLQKIIRIFIGKKGTKKSFVSRYQKQILDYDH